jgi:hypothetical protein
VTSYTHARPIAIPEKSVFRLASRLLVIWLFVGSQMAVRPFRRRWQTGKYL